PLRGARHSWQASLNRKLENPVARESMQGQGRATGRQPTHYNARPPFPPPCMDIAVLEELKAYIDPLTNDEYEALERSLLAEGCRDALVLWGDILVDGHNRYGICRKHGIAFNTVQNTRFESMADVHLWMIEQHLGRRSVSDYQRGVLALRKREILAQRLQAQREAELEALRATRAAQAGDDAATDAAATDAAATDAATAAEDLPPWDPAP